MAISVRNLYELTKDKYKIKLVAGNSGIDNDVRWMYFMEDIEVADFLYGREFVITTGFAMKDDNYLMDLIQMLVERKACGLIINVGKYINEIPQSIIDYCNKMSFPVFIMPWQIHIVDIVKDYCIKIFLSEQTEESIGEAFKKAIFNYSSCGEHIKILENSGFEENARYTVVILKPENDNSLSQNDSNILSENIKICIRDILNRNAQMYNIIEKGCSYIAVLKNNSLEEAEKSFREIADKINLMYKVRVYIGIGSILKGFNNLYSNYKRAEAALFMAKSKKRDLILFDNMGIYRALFTCDNKDVLLEVYNEKLGKLIDYDNKHNTDLKETLKIYLSNNKSVQAVSELTFVHRNTVNYRIKKIKEILKCDFEQYDDIFGYELAFFIEEILFTGNKQ